MEQQTTKTNEEHSTSTIPTHLSYGDTDNKNLSVTVHKSGNTSIMLHNVESVKVSEWEHTPDNEDCQAYDSRDIEIVTEGVKTTFTLFRRD